MRKKYVITLVLISLLLVGSIFLGTSYSLWQRTNVQEGINEIRVGCFNVTFTNLASYGGEEAGDINLLNTFPLREEAGAALTPYMFSIKNECDIASDYTINLETLNTSTFNTDYLSVKFNDVNNVTNNTSTLYKDLTAGTITLTSEANSAKILTTGHLNPNETATYSLRVWINQEATTTTSNVMGETWNGKVVVTSEAADSEPTASDTISEKGKGSDTSSLAVIDKGSGSGNCTYTFAYDLTDDNNLRYVGNNPCNYVSFNGEVWRIIGVMNNIETAEGSTNSLLKIIRKDSLGSYVWDTSNDQVNEGWGINQWGASDTYEGADLMRELNYDYLGDIQVGTDGKWYSWDHDSKGANMPTSTLSTSSQSLIESVVWNLGSPSLDNGVYDTNLASSLTPSVSYSRERSDTTGKLCTSSNSCNDSVVRTSTWTGKIGLMYPSDYGFALAEGTTDRQTCLTYSIFASSWGNNYMCNGNDWLKNVVFSWTMSPYANTSEARNVIRIAGGAYVDSQSSANGNQVHPVVFLKSTVKITGGDGSESNPYTLR